MRQVSSGSGTTDLNGHIIQMPEDSRSLSAILRGIGENTSTQSSKTTAPSAEGMVIL